MALLFDYSKKPASALFIAHSASPDFAGAKARFDALHALSASGGTQVNARFLTGFSGLVPQWAGGTSQNKLLSALAGLPVYANHNGVLLASIGAADAGEVAQYLAQGTTTGEPQSTGERAELSGRESHALYSAARALVKSAGFQTVVCEGWPSFEAGLRLKKELGIKAIFSFHGASADRSVQGQERAAVEAGDALLFSQTGALESVLERHRSSGKTTSISRHAGALAQMTLALNLSSEKAVLERVVSSLGASVEEKRSAIALVKQAGHALELLGANRGVFHLRTPTIALLPHGLTHNYIPSAGPGDFAFARKKMESLSAASGRKLSGKRLIYAHARDAVDGIKMLETLAALPSDVAMAIHSDSAWDFAGNAKRLGVEERAARIEQAGELEMLACEALALPSPTPSVLSSALRACRMAQMAGLAGPVLLLGDNPVHSLSENVLLSRSQTSAQRAYLIASAMEDRALNEKLKMSALAVAGREWTGRASSQELAAFIAGV
jgi:hypothetical protein